MRRVLFLTVFLLLMSISGNTLTGQAQGGCNIDLEDELLMLIRAQRAADSGKDAEAIALLEALQAEFATISDRCGNATVLLPNEFTLPDESLSFRYPDGWMTQEFEENVWITMTDDSLINELNGDDPNFRAGDYIVGIFLEEADAAINFADFIDELEGDMGFSGVISRPEELMIGDRPAVKAIYSTPVDIPFVTVYLDFTDSEENPPAVVMLVAIGLEEELAVLETYAEVIAESVEYPAVASLREEGTALDDLVYTDPIPLDELDENLDPRFAVISPDGTKIASLSDEFCVYTLDSGDISCQESPDGIYPPALYWSPDSRFVAFHEYFARTFRDSDLFLYDDSDGSITKLTDGDDDDMDLFQPSGEVIWDGTVTWGLDNQIYMLRFASDGSGGGGMDALQTLLIRVNPETGDIEELADFSADLPPLASIETLYYMDGVMSVSPDLSQVAFIVNAPSRDFESANGVWVYNMETDRLTHVATSEDLTQGLPDDYVVMSGRVPIAIGWDNTSQGIFVFVTSFTRNDDFTGFYYVDVLNATTQVITDYSDNTMSDLRSEGDELSLVYDLPRAPVIAPNDDGFIVGNQQFATIGLSMIPFENGVVGETIALIPPLEDLPALPAMASSISRDGKLLIYGMLFVPE